MIDLKAIETRCEAARREVNRLCQNMDKWTMSVPAREDDSDIVLTNSFRDIPVLVAEVVHLLERAQRAEAEAEQLRKLIPDTVMLHRLACVAERYEGSGQRLQQYIVDAHILVKRLAERESNSIQEELRDALQAERDYYKREFVRAVEGLRGTLQAALVPLEAAADALVPPVIGQGARVEEAAALVEKALVAIREEIE